MAETTALGWMAYWHDLKWETTPTTIDDNGTVHKGHVEKLENLTLDYSMKTSKVVTKKEGKKKSQTVSTTLQSNKLSFSTTYKTATGTTDINSKLLEIKGYIGYSAPLVIANYDKPLIWGSFYMQLIGVSTSGVEMDETGRVTQATVDFELEETTKKALKKQAVTYPGGSTNAILQSFIKNGEIPDEWVSALKICPNKEIKALIKAKKNKK